MDFLDIDYLEMDAGDASLEDVAESVVLLLDDVVGDVDSEVYSVGDTDVVDCVPDDLTVSCSEKDDQDDAVSDEDNHPSFVEDDVPENLDVVEHEYHDYSLAVCL